MLGSNSSRPAGPLGIIGLAGATVPNWLLGAGPFAGGVPPGTNGAEGMLMAGGTGIIGETGSMGVVSTAGTIGGCVGTVGFMPGGVGKTGGTVTTGGATCVEGTAGGNVPLGAMGFADGIA